jgi:serine/threonine protein phosphatase PrpC
MSPPDIQIEVFGKTDVGLIREHNEDNLLMADLGGDLRESELDAPAKVTLSEHGALFLVCDGMGGAAAGEVASQMAVDAVYETMLSAEPGAQASFGRGLRRAVEIANDRIFQQSRDNQSERGMGTTCTAAALMDDTLMVAQIGDSRCYIFRNGKLGQVTKDQSLAWQLIEAGAMSLEDAKAFEHANIILQALGVQDRVDVVMSQVKLKRGDLMVLCSDGLHGPVSDDEMRDILAAETDLKKAGEGLLQKALERDGPDNITVILARFDGQGLEPATPEDVVAFVGYDPGRDPVSDAADKAGALNSSRIETVPGLAAVKPRRPSGPRGSSLNASRRNSSSTAMGNESTRRGRDARSVMILFVVALLAVAVGGISVLKCERDHATRSEARHAP